MDKKTQVSKRKGNLKKLALVGAIMAGTSAFAQQQQVNTEGFDALYNTVVAWMTGSLGRVIALFGFIGTFIVYAMTHRGSVLFIGILISLIAGGLVGLVSWAFDTGAQVFDFQ
jgi:hypothetical protein